MDELCHFHSLFSKTIQVRNCRKTRNYGCLQRRLPGLAWHAPALNILEIEIVRGFRIPKAPNILFSRVTPLPPQHALSTTPVDNAYYESRSIFQAIMQAGDQIVS